MSEVDIVLLEADIGIPGTWTGLVAAAAADRFMLVLFKRLDSAILRSCILLVRDGDGSNLALGFESI